MSRAPAEDEAGEFLDGSRDALKFFLDGPQGAYEVARGTLVRQLARMIEVARCEGAVAELSVCRPPPSRDRMREIMKRPMLLLSVPDDVLEEVLAARFPR